MDERGRKILKRIMITIMGGVVLYIAIFGLGFIPEDQTGSESARPEGDGIVSPEASVVSEAMIGKWQSIEDPKFTREFREDGTVVDRYEGDDTATIEGIWGAFTADMAPAGTSTAGLSPDVVYVQISEGDTSLYFQVIKAADTLEMAYLGTGGQLNFTKID